MEMNVFFEERSDTPESCRNMQRFVTMKVKEQE